jgi:phenylpropionate dioxygenase-like ring-hydroxylating dioxygenase large terminal subunit
MSRYVKPSEGSWTEHYPELGTAPVDYEDSISPEWYERECAAIFRRGWLNVGRVELLPRVGSYFTKVIAAALASVVVVRDNDGCVRAFHNMCRHRGNMLVWQDDPTREVHGACRQFTCKYHGWRYGLDGTVAFVQQESEFFNLDKSDYALAPEHCEVSAGFVFVDFTDEPDESLEEYLGPIMATLEAYPFDKLTSRFSYRSRIDASCRPSTTPSHRRRKRCSHTATGSPSTSCSTTWST